MPAQFSNHTVTILRDAFDEINEPQQRQVPFPLIHEMKDIGFKFFLSSRSHPADVRETFRHAIQLDIMPEPKDLVGRVRNLLGASFKFRIAIRSSNDGSSPVAVESSGSALMSNADGM